MKTVLYALFFAVALAACGGPKEYMRAETVTTADVRILPIQVWTGGGKLWVRVTVVNSSPSTILVIRDAVRVHLPNGAVLGRATGSTSLHNPYSIPPGGAHAVYVEFEAQGFDWQDVGSAQVDFVNAIMKDGQPIAVPAMGVTR
jgi:hypothetical protein